MEKALQKRPVSREAIEEAITRICQRLRSMGEREVQSRIIGELVMEELRHLDEVGYVRFASVYRSFQDVDEFRSEVDRLSDGRLPSREQLPLIPSTAGKQGRKS